MQIMNAVDVNNKFVESDPLSVLAGMRKPATPET
jgi:hypothetical protein